MSPGERVHLAGLGVLFAALAFWLSCASTPLFIINEHDRPGAIWIEASEPAARLVCVGLFDTAEPLTRFRCLTVRQVRDLVRWSTAN